MSISKGHYWKFLYFCKSFQTWSYAQLTHAVFAVICFKHHHRAHFPSFWNTRKNHHRTDDNFPFLEPSLTLLEAELCLFKVCLRIEKCPSSLGIAVNEIFKQTLSRHGSTSIRAREGSKKKENHQNLTPEIMSNSHTVQL